MVRGPSSSLRPGAALGRPTGLHPAERTCDRFVLLRWHWGDTRGAPPDSGCWGGRPGVLPGISGRGGRGLGPSGRKGHWDSAHQPTTQAEAPPGESASPVGQLESLLSLLPAGAPLPPCPQGTPCPGHALPRQPLPLISPLSPTCLNATRSGKPALATGTGESPCHPFSFFGTFITILINKHSVRELT